VRTADGTIVLGFLAGTHHGDESCPLFPSHGRRQYVLPAPNILREFGRDTEYSNSGNLALGVAHDGAVLLLAHGHKGNLKNHIFGWRSGGQWAHLEARGHIGARAEQDGVIHRDDRATSREAVDVTGHYRRWFETVQHRHLAVVSPDDGLTWGEPAMVNNLNAGEPVLVRAGDQLLVFVRGRGPANARQFISISDDWGKTWKTELSTIITHDKRTTGLAHPFAMVNPLKTSELIAVTSEGRCPAASNSGAVVCKNSTSSGTARFWNCRRFPGRPQRLWLRLALANGRPACAGVLLPRAQSGRESDLGVRDGDLTRREGGQEWGFFPTPKSGID